MKLIPLTRGQFAKVDDEDFELFGKTKWYASVNGRHMYAARKNGGESAVYLHRAIMNAPSGMVVDHINHDTFDCRKKNLRICAVGQNNMNRRGASSHSKSGVRGVYWHKRAGKWTAMLRLNGKGRYLGLFVSKKAAAMAFSSATREYFGEFGMDKS